MSMENNSHVKIVIKDMVVDVRIGLYAHEKAGGRSQRIIVNVELFLDKSYLSDITPETIMDYDTIHSAILGWSEAPHVLLIETYANDLLDICFTDDRVEAAKISITKPDIFDDVERAGVEVFMTRVDWSA